MQTIAFCDILLVMNTLEQTLFLGTLEGQRIKRYTIDALIALVTTLAVTGVFFALKLYPAIPNISIFYLLIVLALASSRGLYAALVASVIAFISFDFFLVEPLFTFTIRKPEEWLALCIFLVTAITTGRLASALRKRAEQAIQHARETEALYELVNTATNEGSLERQLHVVARAIVEKFAAAGIQDCAILLLDEHGKLVLQADANQSLEEVHLSADEEKTAMLAMTQGRIIDLYMDLPATAPAVHHPTRYRRVVTSALAKDRYVRIIPLRMGAHTLGAARLLMASSSHHLPEERAPDLERARLDPQTAFFWTFLDQATSMIERARLHREAVQIELLQRTDALRSALLSSASHDLRTPLASIKAAASSLLQDDVQWDEETRRGFAQAIEHETDRLNRLVGNLLDMSRIEGGALQSEKELYPIVELIHDVLGHMHFLLQDRVVQFSLPDDLPPVPLDYLQIDQVLTNLLENAVRYTPQDSPIEVSATVVADRVMVSIADHGPGIPPFDLERIFDKFYRVSGRKRTGSSSMGTGLGLAVCRGLVEAHGGRIWAENRPEGGAVFRFTLPLLAEGVEL